jgi:hypothetical protein
MGSILVTRKNAVSRLWQRIFLYRRPVAGGGDGRQCWSRIGNQFVVAPSDSIALKDVLIADPLRSESDQSDEAVIKELGLEYVGDEQHRGRTCHRLRSLQPRTIATTGLINSEFREWLIDAKTLLPVLFEEFGDTPVRYEFSFDSIDQELPAETFRPPSQTGLTPIKPEPLGDGYDQRFLNALDGSAARISIRWGKTAKGGTSRWAELTKGVGTL